MIGAKASEDLIRKAQAYIATMSTVTVADLQRQFSLGYSSAASLMDDLALLGSVGPYQVGGTHEVIL